MELAPPFFWEYVKRKWYENKEIRSEIEILDILQKWVSSYNNVRTKSIFSRDVGKSTCTYFNLLPVTGNFKIT